eukprot:COSAG01_NODE_962_length_12418_cov_57.124492_6_plen_339_part_00
MTEQMWRGLVKAHAFRSDADLQNVATLLLTSCCLCTLCAAMVGSLASSGAMQISAQHDDVLAALAAAERDLLAVEGARELDQELTSFSNALRQHNAAVQQVEAGEGAGGADQPPLPKGRSRSSEVIGDKEKVHTGSTTVGDEWRKAEDNRKKQLVRACDSVGIWYRARVCVSPTFAAVLLQERAANVAADGAGTLPERRAKKRKQPEEEEGEGEGEGDGGWSGAAAAAAGEAMVTAGSKRRKVPCQANRGRDGVNVVPCTQENGHRGLCTGQGRAVWLSAAAAAAGEAMVTAGPGRCQANRGVDAAGKTVPCTRENRHRGRCIGQRYAAKQRAHVELH